MKKQKPIRPDPKDQQQREMREKPALDPDDKSELPETSTREEIEKIRPNLKR